jgi:hypothetical protein
MNCPWADDFAAAGYKPYHDFIKGRPEDRFYKGSWQRRIIDDRGTRYFINVNLYEFDGTRAASAEVQFHTLDDREGDAINIDRRVNAIPEIEAFFAEVWEKLGCGYYEVDP